MTVNQVPYVESLRPQRRVLRTLHREALFSSSSLLAGLSILAILAYVAAILSGPILREADTYTSFSHLYVWMNEVRSGQFFPVWTPVDANGFGSPMPFFYHKAFNIVGALIGLAAGDIVTGYRGAVLVFSAVMFVGVDLCARRLDADRIASFAIASVSLLAPYMLNKVFAGTVAEFAAAAIVPLILALVLDAFSGIFGFGRAVGLLLALLLLTQTHVLVFVIALGALFPALLYLVIRQPVRGALPFGAMSIAIGVFIALIYVPFNYWSTWFCPDQARLFGPVANLLLSPKDILWRSPTSSFGWPFYSLFIGLAAVAVKPRGMQKRPVRVAVTLGCVVLCVLFMMTRLAYPFWRLSGPLEFIQVPYRLLSLATPLCVVALAGLYQQFPFRTRRWLQCAMLAFALVQSFRLADRNLQDSRPLPVPELSREVPTAALFGPDAAGEYFPKWYRPALAASNPWKTGKSVTTVLPKPRPFIEASGCSFADQGHVLSLGSLSIPVSCPAGGSVRINQFATPFIGSVAINAQGEQIMPLAGREMIEYSLPPGQWTLQIHTRSYARMIELAWRAIFTKLTKAGV